MDLRLWTSAHQTKENNGWTWPSGELMNYNLDPSNTNLEFLFLDPSDSLFKSSSGSLSLFPWCEASEWYMWYLCTSTLSDWVDAIIKTLIARIMGPTWGPPGADRARLDHRLTPWTLPSGKDVDTLRPRRNGCHFLDDIFKCIFWNQNVGILIKVSLKFCS